MKRDYLDGGLKYLAGYFEQPYKQHTIDVCIDELLTFSEDAFSAAMKRIVVEFNPKPLPPFDRIMKIIREEAAKHRENEAYEENRSAPTLSECYPATQAGRDALLGLKMFFEEKTTPEQMRQYFKHMMSAHPGIYDVACAKGIMAIMERRHGNVRGTEVPVRKPDQKTRAGNYTEDLPDMPT